MIRVAICDDNVAIASQIENEICGIAESYRMKVECEIFFDGVRLLEKLQAGEHFDLLYLDIEMPEQNGVEIANTIREEGWPLLIIYISSHEEYMKEICFTEPFGFLTKPVKEKEFEALFLKAVQRINRKPEFFSFSYQKAVGKLILSDIAYFESRGKTVLVHLVQKKAEEDEESVEVKFYGRINDVQKQLENSKTSFLRIHQSYLVNYDQIRELRFMDLTMEDGTVLQISKNRQKEVRERFCLLAGRGRS
ncbi:MAG: response regulator transcription factor [Lachnospiraceae bacterium]|nr:response regulator transcription factor [Lachnospiraceae bacterium]